MSEKSLILIQQENLELSKENSALKETVTKLLEEIQRLREVSIIQSPNATRITVTPEQRIVNEQIHNYEQLSIRGPLTLDDIRALDILIKNKRLLDENKPIEPDYNIIPENKTESDLIRIAGNVEESQFKRRRKSKTGSKDPVA